MDAFLGGYLTIEQPRQGYRAGSDTVLLAAAVPAVPGQSVIEFGCGVGTASLCLGWRVKQLAITGIDIQPEMVTLAQRNIGRNTLDSAVTVMQGDVTAWQLQRAGQFDHVMMNPPYHEAGSHTVSPRDHKRIAHTESDGDLRRWIDNAIDMLKPGGVLTLIHRADRLPEIIDVLKQACGGIAIISLVPKAGAEAKRLVIRAAKGGLARIQNHQLVLHQDDGRYQPDIDAVLRHGRSLDSVLT